MGSIGFSTNFKVYFTNNHALNNGNSVAACFWSNFFLTYYTQRFAYKDGRIDLTTYRGWLGFAKIIVYNEDLQTKTVKTFYQDFPLTGQLSTDSLQYVTHPLYDCHNYTNGCVSDFC